VYFLATDFLDMTSSWGMAPRSATSLAQKLAKLHTTPAPIPAGFDVPQFGFPVPTCCGNTEQDNGFTASWAEFYADKRLRMILRTAETANGVDKGLREAVERTARVVVPRLLGDDHLGGGEKVMPVTVHGDLWSGNKGTARFGGKGEIEEVVFDPSACYAHSEYELGIMNMFGGFSGAWMREYHKLVPKTRPVEEYEDRVELYEL
jgi:fructosamine-3-kinase